MNIDNILLQLNIPSLNLMQKEAERTFRQAENAVLLSPTGSGKTLAYLLPLVELMKEDLKDEVQALVIVPSRELAMQVAGVFKQMKTGFDALAVYGGRPAADEHKVMKSLRPVLIVGTPGRLADHLAKGNFNAGTVRLLVLDEFDKCLELGFKEEMSQVIGQLPEVRKRLLISATRSDGIPAFVGMKTKPVYLDYLTGERQREARIDFYEVDSPDKDKLQTLYALLCTRGAESSIVFLNYRESVERTAGFLMAKGFACETFHGKMEQDERERALYKFANGTCNVLVSTDLAARGLDLPLVDNIIHYHFPLDKDAYIHRNGRTARYDATGRSFILKGPEEKLADYMTGLQAYPLPDTLPSPAQPRWQTLYIGKGKKEKVSKGDILGFLCKKGGLTMKEVGRIDVRDYCAYAAVAREKADEALRRTAEEKLKGKKTLVEVAK